MSIENSSSWPSREIKAILHSGFLEPMMFFPVTKGVLQLLLLPELPWTREGGIPIVQGGIFLMGTFLIG